MTPGEQPGTAFSSISGDREAGALGHLPKREASEDLAAGLERMCRAQRKGPCPPAGAGPGALCQGDRLQQRGRAGPFLGGSHKPAAAETFPEIWLQGKVIHNHIY